MREVTCVRKASALKDLWENDDPDSPDNVQVEASSSFTVSMSSVCWRISTCRLSQALLTPSSQSRLPLLLTFPRYQRYATSTDTLPRVAQPSIWHSIIPKAFRTSNTSQVLVKPQRSTEWNPATFFIWIFLLIGSNGIQMLTLRNEYSTFSRKADQKIALLKEVLDKVQRGENVDVEKVLGTGDEKQEQEWKDGELPVDIFRIYLSVLFKF